MNLTKAQETKVLSICSDILGNSTYGKLLQNYFSNEHTSVELDFHWWCENLPRGLKALLYNALVFRIPFNLRNLDFRQLRVSLGCSGITQTLVEKSMLSSDYNVLHIHTQNNAYLSLGVMKKIPTVIGIDYTAALLRRDAISISKPTFLPSIRLEKQIFEAASHIASMSNLAKLSVIEDYGIEEHKVTVIPPGIDFKQLGLLEACNRTNQNQRPNILFVGGSFKRKGGEDLLKVFLENFSEAASLHLVTKKAVQCNHPNVHVYNNIEAYSTTWTRLYQQADLFVMPSYHEGLPHVYVEAMGFALPVIASNLVQIAEVVTPGETGFMVAPGNHSELAQCLKRLIENPDLRLRMGQASYKAATQKFDARTNFARLEQVFHEAAMHRSKDLSKPLF